MFGQEELKLKRRRTVVSTVIVAVLIVFLSIDQLTVQRQTSFMTGLITQEMKQGSLDSFGEGLRRIHVYPDFRFSSGFLSGFCAFPDSEPLCHAGFLSRIGNCSDVI